MNTLSARACAKRFKRAISKLLILAMLVGVSATTQMMEVKAASSTTYEAEDSAVCDSSTARKIHTGTTNASGGKSATLYTGEYITYTVTADSAGTYDVLIRYAGASIGSATTSTTIPLEITVGNGAATTHKVAYPNHYNTFQDYSFSVSLTKGTNKITIKNVIANNSGSDVFANIDKITVTKIADATTTTTTSGTYEAEDSAVCDSSTARKIHTGTTNASGGKSATLYTGEYITYTVTADSAGTYDVNIRYAGATNPVGTSPTSIPFEIKVGSEAAKHVVTYPGNYNTFQDYKFSAKLAAGTNKLVIKNVSEDATVFANVDKITVTKNSNAIIATPAVGTVEAEEAEIVGGTISQNSVFSGGKYVEAMNKNTNGDMSQAEYLTYKVNAGKAGSYKVYVYYTTASASTKYAVKVNDGAWMNRTVTSTGAWNKLAVDEYVIALQEGINTITVTGSIDTGWIIFDKFVMEESTGEVGSVKKTAKQLQEQKLVSYRGRNMNIGDSVSFDYTASGFEFIYEGKGNVVANITTTGNEKFAIDVDGNVRYHSVGAGTADITLASNLASGTHTIKVYKTQEAMSGLAQLNYMTYDGNATLKPIATAYKFLIIGASSTCGNQIDPDTGAENGYLAFPSLVSRAYNATWQQISCSGRGVVQGTLGESGWVFSQNGMLAEMYEYQSWFRDKNTKYNTASYTPDVIITNFNNDFSGTTRAKGYNVDEIFAKMMQFITKLRATYPNAYIAMTYGNYPTYETDGRYNNYDIINGYINAVNNYKASSGDKKIDFITFPSVTGGASGHPSEEDHQYLAELVSEKVSAALNVQNPLPRTRFEVESGKLVNAGDTGKVARIETWASKHSNNSYVEGMNVNLNGAAIASNGSNVKYVSVPVTVAKAGNYKIEINYGTNQKPVVYVRANGGSWKSLTLASTSDWNKIGQNAEYTVYLSAGQNTIDITGGTNGSYVCLDRIDLIYSGN